MGQSQNHGVLIVQDKAQRLFNQPKPHEAAIDHAVITQDHLPKENPHQIAGPKWDGDQKDPHGLAFGRDMERDEIGHRIGQKHR